MRKPVLALIALAAIGAAIWWFGLRGSSRSPAPGAKPAEITKAVTVDPAAKKGTGTGDSDRAATSPFSSTMTREARFASRAR